MKIRIDPGIFPSFARLPSLPPLRARSARFVIKMGKEEATKRSRFDPSSFVAMRDFNYA